MQIEKLIINSFGMLLERTFDLSEGINLIEGENESGKSSLAAFIKFMLYGFSKRAATERQRYINWHTDEASGAMIISHDGKKYRIERSVKLIQKSESGRESYKESLAILDGETGAKLYSGEVPGEVFLGVGAEVYENTAYVKQLGVTGVDGAVVSDAIQNILFSADESINTAKAAEKLNILRRSLLHKNEKGGEIYELTLEASRLEAALSRAKDENCAIIAKESEREGDTLLISECREHLSGLNAKKEAYELLELIRRFERYGAVKTKLATLMGEYEKYREESSKDGFIPDKNYLRELIALEREGISFSSEIFKLEDEHRKLLSESLIDPGLESVYEEIRSEGGRDDVKAKHGLLLASKKNMTTFSAVTCALGILGIAAGAVVLSVMTPLAALGYVLLGTGVVSLAAACGFFFARSKRAAAYGEYLLRFGAKNAAELDIMIERSYENEAEGRRHRESLAALESSIAQKKAERDAIRIKIREMTELWGRADSEVHSVIADAEAVCERSADSELEIRKYADMAERAHEELKEYSEENVRRRFDALGVSDVDKIVISELTREIDYTKKRLESLTERKIDTEKALIALGAMARDPASVAAELSEVVKKLSEKKKKHAATLLAEEAIMTASENLRAGVTPRLSSGAREIMARVTAGKYSEGGFSQADGAFSISFESEGGMKSLDLLSTGTQDAAYISLRLSLTDILYKRGKSALILDESFAYLDDKRTSELLSVLEDSDMQILIFTCRDRERRLLSGKKYEHIML